LWSRSTGLPPRSRHSIYDDAIDSARTALLIMDVQQAIVERLGDPPNRSLLDHIASAADAARASGIRVVYVTIGFRAGHPEVSPRNPMFARLVEMGGFVEGSSTEVHEALAPRPGDVVVVKRRVSALFPRQAEVLTADEWASGLPA
jgi:nicotinamidase-related amidase